MKNLLQLHFYAEKEGKKHASLWVNLLCGSLAIYSLLRPGKLNQSCGSNPPTATFFRLLCFVHLLYGDNVFEKCGINRDGAGEVGKPRYFNGKRHF